MTDVAYMFRSETSDAHEMIWYLGQCVATLRYWRIRVDIGRARNHRIVRSSERMDAAQERYRNAVMIGASEKERTPGGHIWSRGPRGSQVTPASDGASRFHDDVRCVSLSSLYLGVPPFLSPRSLFDAILLARFSPGTKNTDGCSVDEKDRRRPKEKNGREVLFRDYRGLPAFWNRADRLHSQYRTCSSFPRAAIFAISEFCRLDLSDFARGIVDQYVDYRSQRGNIYSCRLVYY